MNQTSFVEMLWRSDLSAMKKERQFHGLKSAIGCFVGIELRGSWSEIPRYACPTHPAIGAVA